MRTLPFAILGTMLSVGPASASIECARERVFDDTAVVCTAKSTESSVSAVWREGERTVQRDAHSHTGSVSFRTPAPLQVPRTLNVCLVGRNEKAVGACANVTIFPKARAFWTRPGEFAQKSIVVIDEGPVAHALRRLGIHFKFYREMKFGAAATKPHLIIVGPGLHFFGDGEEAIRKTLDENCDAAVLFLEPFRYELEPIDPKLGHSPLGRPLKSIAMPASFGPITHWRGQKLDPSMRLIARLPEAESRNAGYEQYLQWKGFPIEDGVVGVWTEGVCDRRTGEVWLPFVDDLDRDPLALAWLLTLMRTALGLS